MQKSLYHSATQASVFPVLCPVRTQSAQRAGGQVRSQHNVANLLDSAHRAPGSHTHRAQPARPRMAIGRRKIQPMSRCAALRRKATATALVVSAGPWCAVAMVLLAGCEWHTPASFLAARDREIGEATRAIETSRDDAHRAQAHVDRARAYSEKARYSRAFKLVALEEYGQLFDLAITDHDRAVALSPGDADVYLKRGLTYYDRAALELRGEPGTKALFEAARTDFTSAIERDRRNEQALDMRGLVHTANDELDLAIDDFAEVMRINPRLGKLRLAEAYCQRGSSFLRGKQYDLAIVDFETAIGLDAPSDGCDCQSDWPLAATYYEKRQYDKSWEVVHRAQRARRWIAPEFIVQLKTASGRDK
jgi:lipoprotein NlpI